MKVWISKYALRKGVYSVEAEPYGDGAVRVKNTLWGVFCNEGKDWHRTKESALTRAEYMRKQKIISLKKQLSRLQKLDFINQGVK